MFDNADDQVINELNAEATGDSLAHRMFNPKLAALRAQNPFIQIMPFPNSSITVKLSADTPVEIQIPSGAKIMLVTVSSVSYMSRNGNAQMPTASIDNQSASIGLTVAGSPIYRYVEEMNSFSIVSSSINTNVSVEFFNQL